MAKVKEMFLKVKNGECQLFFKRPKGNSIHVIEKSVADKLARALEQIGKGQVYWEDQWSCPDVDAYRDHARCALKEYREGKYG